MNPAKSFIFGLIIYSSLLIVAPVEITVEITEKATIFLLINLVAFYLGLVCANSVQHKNNQAVLRTKKNHSKFELIILLIFSILSVLFFIVDFYYYREISFTKNFLENRESIAEVATTPFGIASALLTAAPFLLYFRVLQNNSPSKLLLILCLTLIFATPILSIAAGSRSLLLNSILLSFSLYLINRKKRFSKKSIFFSVIWLLVFLLWSTNQFLNRVSVMEMDVIYSSFYSTYAETVKPDKDYVFILENTSNSSLFILKYTILNIAQYYLHGLFELFRQINGENLISHSFGTYLFFVPYKTFSLFLELPDVFTFIESSRLTQGAYTSFLGPVHSDFGWLSPIFIFIFSFFCQNIKIKSAHNKHFIPLNTIFCLTIFFFPVVNFLIFGHNFYILTGFLIYAYASLKIRL